MLTTLRLPARRCSWITRLMAEPASTQTSGQEITQSSNQDYADLFNILDMSPAQEAKQSTSQDISQGFNDGSDDLFPDVWLNNILDTPATSPEEVNAPSTSVNTASLAPKAPLLATLLDNSAPILDNAVNQAPAQPSFDISVLLGGAMSAQKIKKEKAMAKEESDSEDEDEDAPRACTSRRMSKASAAKAQKKLYECEPFDDPVLEKKRLDALHAKENRDKKKAEKNCLVEENKQLRKENRGLKRREKQLETRIEDMEKTVERLMQIILSGNQGQQQGMAGNSNPKNQFRVTSFPKAVEKPAFIKFK